MRHALLAAGVAVLLSACAALQPPTDVASTYVLEARPVAESRQPRHDRVLAVSAPRAYPGFDTARMAYVPRAHELEYFADNRWADTPPRMLAPLLARALEQSGRWRAVVLAPSAAAADLRLDVEVVRLLQDFETRPSRVRFTLRAQLVEIGTRRVLATREFDESEAAASENPYGGVIAANRALERLLGRIAEFSAAQSIAK